MVSRIPSKPGVGVFLATEDFGRDLLILRNTGWDVFSPIYWPPNFEDYTLEN